MLSISLALKGMKITIISCIHNEQEKVYISRLEEDDNNFNFREITDPDEWVAVQNAINEILSNADEGVENVKS